jgi:hypothetical protein
MPATLKLTHKAIGAEVRRGTYDVVVDGERAGSVDMNHTIEIPVEPGRHTLQVRNGRNSTSTQTFDASWRLPARGGRGLAGMTVLPGGSGRPVVCAHSVACTRAAAVPVLCPGTAGTSAARWRPHG